MCSKRCAKPGAARLLVGRADVVPEVDGDERQPMILGQDHVEAVRQRVFFEVDLRDIALRRRSCSAGFRNAACVHATEAVSTNADVGREKREQNGSSSKS